MPEGNEYRDRYDQAQRAHGAGNNVAAIHEYSRLVSDLMQEGVQELQDDQELLSLLDDAAQSLTEVLRWEQEYDQAITLQDRLVAFFPEDEPVLRTYAANLKIEGGYKQEGLQELHHIAEADADNIWGWITLATGYMWDMHYQEAEQYLRQAASIEQADPKDRALALKYLFDILGIQKRVHEAVDTWEEMCQLDPELRATLPELCSMLIYRRHLSTAQDYLQLERSKLRRWFYGGLSDFSKNMMPQAAEEWTKVVAYNPEQLEDEHDEFAEACIRVLQPSLALKVLQPMIEQGQVTYRRLILNGLAWAQRRVINHAMGSLDIALRMADLERPRRTRPGGRPRIFDAQARILYGQVRIDPDVRSKLDRYFIPGK